ncbi:polyprenyl synthetase family protein [Actinokineospora sp. NBRC 105648]|uniref:polyprenyl synthetase family protein n=1 Tax=Actinokineospora sp. NBRC 105648 TaxID=3032206 RepID=UPI0024A0D39A|nr:polyprenyl synthetase family protein [Actinokineospora sp. NBRC 105648]GLZ40533.1 polyprenyl synthetase [Actinokineospora sp. NBRC 105648]
MGLSLADQTPVTEHEPFDRWRARVRDSAAAQVGVFVSQRCDEHLAPAPETAFLGEVLVGFVASGKFLRSAFVLAGVLCGQPESAAAVRAAASAELLHCFALLQDDVMDGSPTRRGAPSAHVRFADWHRRAGLPGSSARFGESAAVLAADLCLVWASQLLRECGLPPDAVARALPRYDWMRAELAVGQLRDLANQASEDPSLVEVLAIARAKSGHYTVRRPVELGADLAGCLPEVLAALGVYGDAIGEAFQLRDDLLGLFGDPATTGKPRGEDLRAGRATSVLVVARDLATPAQRRALRLGPEPGDDAVDRCLAVVEETGARHHVERLIDQRLRNGLAALASAAIPVAAREYLTGLARLSCVRDH